VASAEVLSGGEGRQSLPAGLPRHGESDPGWPGRPALWWATLLTAGVLCAITFIAGGGLRLGPMTAAEMGLTIGSGLVIAATVLLGGEQRGGSGQERVYGLWPVGLLLAFTALTALSVVWSVQPEESWQDAGRMLAYSAIFGASVAVVRVAPSRWPALLGGVTLAAFVVCVYALLTKVFPGQFDANDTYARLRAPYGYWNAIGLTAAMGVICCMWLGARRAGHALLSALAYPAMGVMLVTLMLAYSRGALVALVLGVVLWLSIVPLRLRGAAVLLSGAAGAAVVIAWDFSQHALSSEGVPEAMRTKAGHQLGVLLLVLVVVLLLAGLAIGFAGARRALALDIRRRAGAALLIGLALAAVLFVGALAASQRGLTGTVSHDFNSLTNPNAKVPPNTPDRLTAIASVRARYWNEALEIFQDHPVLGAGAGTYGTARLRYRTETLDVKDAHGYIVQTLSDLGLLGLVLTLALLTTWMAAAARSTHPFDLRWKRGLRRVSEPQTPERIGLLTMLCVVVVFGLHSLADWTWYVPGDACVALLCAGWLAGRGPLAGPASAEEGALAQAQALRFTPLSTVDRRSQQIRSRVIAGAVLIAVLLAAWAQWQPLRSEDASQEALALLARNPTQARAAAQRAIARDPLSVQALFTLAQIQQAGGESAAAEVTFQRAVRLQPSNPQTWLALGEHDLSASPRAALNELRAAIYLNPESIAPELITLGNPEALAIQSDYIQALRASTPAPVALTPAPVSAGHSPAAASAGPGVRRPGARQRPRSRSPRAGG